MECRHSVSKSNDIDIDPNYDNPEFVSCRLFLGVNTKEVLMSLCEPTVDARRG